MPGQLDTGQEDWRHSGHQGMKGQLDQLISLSALTEICIGIKIHVYNISKKHGSLIHIVNISVYNINIYIFFNAFNRWENSDLNIQEKIALGIILSSASDEHEYLNI